MPDAATFGFIQTECTECQLMERLSVSLQTSAKKSSIVWPLGRNVYDELNRNCSPRKLLAAST